MSLLLLLLHGMFPFLGVDDETDNQREVTRMSLSPGI
jgi:hypothetical protein